jgi:hypothetical protein
MPFPEYLFALASGLLGAAVGLSELASRYNSFYKVFTNGNSWLYLGLNFVAGFTVYAIVVMYSLNLGPLTSHHIGRVLTCGLGAMAILRSAFSTFKDPAGKQTDIGLAALVSVFLKVAETQFDRELSTINIQKVAAIVNGLKFLSASKDLPILVLGSMRVLSAEEQKQISDDILKLINDNTITTEIKNVALGLILIKYTGEELLKTSVAMLVEKYKALNVLINDLKPVVISDPAKKA